MRSFVCALCALFAVGAALAEPRAALEALATLPANSFIAPPADASQDFASPGNFSQSGLRNSDVMHPRTRETALPAPGQVVQGVSALRAAGDGSWWALSDNGFGAKLNSPDAMLMLHRVRFDWARGAVTVEETLFLSDPNFQAPFHIGEENSTVRYLTGADFDPESLVVRADGGFIIGEEFGPYLLGFDAQGRLEWARPAMADGQLVRSVDNPLLGPTDLGETSPANLRRSRGFEGMDASGDAILAMLEGPIQTKDGPEKGLRILEYSPKLQAFTRKSWLYTLEDPRHAIGELTVIGPGLALVIERDNGQGDAARACAPERAAVPAPTDCFLRPARFKRIYRVRLPEGGGAVVKEASIDLLTLVDGRTKPKKRRAPPTFSFPFQTIESVAVLPDGRLLIANDNNFPFGRARAPDEIDATEFIIVRPPEGFLDP
jgi:hypothetical protein